MWPMRCPNRWRYGTPIKMKFLLLLSRGCKIKCVSWLSVEELRRRNVEEETDDHSTRTTRRTAQRLPDPAGSLWGRRASQATHQRNDRTLPTSRDARAPGLSQAWTKEAREHQHPQWLRAENAQERTRRVADQRAA